MKIALILEYDGRNYCGWQQQPDFPSVQSMLETAASRIASHPVRIIAAGRTDAGVHALYQVAHFETDAKRPSTAWVRGVNSFLPKDISVLWASRIDDDFHARFSAVKRIYRYYLLSRPTRPAIGYKRVGWVHYPLHLEKMRQAAELLIGKHDFSAFRSAECQSKTAVRNLTGLHISCHESLYIFEFCANAFLQHMIRNIVGGLVYVGQQKQSPEWMQELLQARDRTLSAPTLSPDGLYLAGVHYETKWSLPTPDKLQLASII